MNSENNDQMKAEVEKPIRLYEVKSTSQIAAKNGHTYNDVSITWFVSGRKEPVAPYEEVIYGPWVDDPYTQWGVDECFTEEEAKALVSMLEEKFGDETAVIEAVPLPIGRDTSYEDLIDIGPRTQGLIGLHKYDGYSLPFCVKGFYDIANCKIAPDHTQGVEYLKTALQMLFIPMIADSQLESVAARIFEESGMEVRSRKPERIVSDMEEYDPFEGYDDEF